MSGTPKVHVLSTDLVTVNGVSLLGNGNLEILNGKSAYELYVAGLGEGVTPLTEAEWILSLQGDLSPINTAIENINDSLENNNILQDPEKDKIVLSLEKTPSFYNFMAKIYEFQNLKILLKGLKIQYNDLLNDIKLETIKNTSKSNSEKLKIKLEKIKHEYKIIHTQKINS